MTDELQELADYLHKTFPTAAELQQYLTTSVWPAFKQREREALREQRLAEKLALNAARLAQNTAEMEKRRRLKRTGMFGTPDADINVRFCELDGSPLSNGEVIKRSKVRGRVRERATGAIMIYKPVTVAGVKGGRWETVGAGDIMTESLSTSA